MSIEYVRDFNGKIVATVKKTGNQTYLHDFKSGKVLASYREGTDTTLDWAKNHTLRGNQLLRFVK